MSRYRAAIIGLSWIASDPAGEASHPVLGTAVPYSHASAYAAVPSVEVVAGCDISERERDAFRARWEGTWPGLRMFDDYRRLLAEVRPDVLSVVTPDQLHAEIVIAAAESGVRAIFCEKPMAIDLADADAMVEAVRKYRVTMAVNFTRRWAPEFVTARQMIRDGKIGAVSQIFAHYGGERAMLFRNHSHFLDLLSYYAESNPVWVMAELEAKLADYGLVYKGDGGRDPATEPGVNAYVAYENGVRGYLSGMKEGFQEVAVRVIGAKGRLDIGDGEVAWSFMTETGRVEQRVQPQRSQAGMQAAVVDLLEALEAGRETESPPEEARKAVALTMAILESQASGNVKVAVQ